MTLLIDMVTIFALSALVLLVCHRLKIPAIIGFLFTGVLCGPYGLGWVHAVHEVELAAEIGVILLLFTIGIEFSISELMSIKKIMLLGGTLQVALTGFAVTALAVAAGVSPAAALFTGFLISLSSTAIVMRQYQAQAQTGTPHGKAALGILIFQDLAIVPMMLVTPLLAGKPAAAGYPPMVTAMIIPALIGGAWVTARWIAPPLFYRIARTRSRELFLLTLTAMVFGISGLTYKAGLSLALGAFLAGLILSESDYSLQALGSILPFKDLFTSLFFVSIGMLLDMRILLDAPLVIAGSTLGILLIKAIVTTGVLRLMGASMKTACIAGIGLSQAGEFSFILSKAGSSAGLITPHAYQIFLATAILTMGATPYLMKLAPLIARKLPDTAQVPEDISLPLALPESGNHMIIIGFGISGRQLASAARVSNLPYTIIEMNPETVRQHKTAGEPIFYGDATREAVLIHAGIKSARVMVIVINDPAAIRRIVEVAKRVHPGIHLIVRTRFVKDVRDLSELGAEEVIPEELETSVEIFTRVLSRYLVPRNEIERLVNDIRSDHYSMLRTLSIEPGTVYDLSKRIPGMEVATLRIEPGFAHAGKPIARSRIRETYQITLLAIQKGKKIISPPAPSDTLDPGDVIYLFGTPDAVTRLIRDEQP
ncbi:MAG: potassium transporter KefB [Deltaproteobacteria bacterium]|nr:MAG: potassium transporter KefB [Deltaproteobacteria bacterium]